MLLRDMGGRTFATLRDSSGSIQLMATAQETDDYKELTARNLGDWLVATGEVIRSRRGELSVLVDSWQLLAEARRGFGDKWRGITDTDLRYRQRYADLWANDDSRRVFQARSRIMSETRRFLEGRGFVEVETPLLHPIPGGALARPFITHHNALDLDIYLRVAPELYLKRLVVGGFERVFELGRVFRNEGIDATHNTEFTMLESNSAFQDYRDMMELARGVIQEAADAAGKGRRLAYRGREVDLDGDWSQVTLLDAVRDALGQPDLAYDWPLDRVRELCHRTGVPTEPGWGTGKLVLELYEKHAEHRIVRPTFVTDHPVEVSPLAHPHRDDPFVTERFELIIGGREYANCFSELTDPDEQRLRFEEQALAKAGGDEEAMVVDEAYLRSLELGLPPNAGLGIGVDRLVMLLGDLSSIREALLFPQLRPEEL
jgi:lysyl-tRNA synthetase class 2